MTDLYIATPTQADYDALIRLAEAAGFEWASGNKMSEEPNNYLDEREETVIHLDARLHEIWYDNPRRYEGKIIEGIPNLADIKAIWKVQPDNHKAFFKGKSYKHPLPSDESVIMLEMTDELAERLMDIYKALAVEYKPQESKAMNEKVKLPRPIYNALKAQGFSIHGIKCDKGSFLPIITLFGMATVSDKSEPSEYEALTKFLYSKSENQWKLIDALRYGCDPEPEPRWGIKAGNCYMDNTIEWQFDIVINPSATLDEFAYFVDKTKADDLVKTLGFGEVVDLNKED